MMNLYSILLSLKGNVPKTPFISMITIDVYAFSEEEARDLITVLIKNSSNYSVDDIYNYGTDEEKESKNKY